MSLSAPRYLVVEYVETLEIEKIESKHVTADEFIVDGRGMHHYDNKEFKIRILYLTDNRSEAEEKVKEFLAKYNRQSKKGQSSDKSGGYVPNLDTIPKQRYMSHNIYILLNITAWGIRWKTRVGETRSGGECMRGNIR